MFNKKSILSPAFCQHDQTFDIWEVIYKLLPFTFVQRKNMASFSNLILNQRFCAALLYANDVLSASLLMQYNLSEREYFKM